MFCPLLHYPFLEKLDRKESIIDSGLEVECDKLFEVLNKYNSNCIVVDNLGDESCWCPSAKYEACDLCYCQNINYIDEYKCNGIVTVQLLSVKDFDVKEAIDEFFSQVAVIEHVRSGIPYQLDYICSDNVNGIMCSLNNSEWFIKNTSFNKEIIINDKMGNNVILFKNGISGAAIPFKTGKEDGIEKVIKFGLVLFADYIDVMGLKNE